MGGAEEAANFNMLSILFCKRVTQDVTICVFKYYNLHGVCCKSLRLIIVYAHTASAYTKLVKDPTVKPSQTKFWILRCRALAATCV